MPNPPTSTSILRLHNTFRRDRHTPKVKALPSQTALKDPPEYLGEAERKRWQFAIDHAPRGLLLAIDRDLLAAWCVQATLHEQAVVAMQGEPLVIETESTTKPNPKLAVQHEAARMLLRLEAQLGFSPISRARLRIDQSPETPEMAAWQNIGNPV